MKTLFELVTQSCLQTRDDPKERLRRTPLQLADFLKERLLNGPLAAETGVTDAPSFAEFSVEIELFVLNTDLTR